MNVPTSITEILNYTARVTITVFIPRNMAEKPEDLNLPNAVISRLVKEAVCAIFCLSRCIYKNSCK
jgi:hypothetical protein